MMVIAAEIDDQLLKPAEVAQLLRVSQSSLANMRCRGRGPKFVKLGTGRSGAVRYRRSDIEAWLADPASIDASRRQANG